MKIIPIPTIFRISFEISFPCRITSLALLFDDFIGKQLVGCCAAAVLVVGKDRQTVAGGLRQTNIAGDHGGKYLAGEMAANFLRHLIGEVGASVKHGQQDAEDAQVGVETPFDCP